MTQIVEALLTWLGIVPSEAEQEIGRPAEEIIREVEEREQEEAQKIEEALEEVRSDPSRPLTMEEFLKALEIKRNGGGE